MPFKAYSAANDVCGTPYTVKTYRDLVTRFFEDSTPDTSRLRVCFNGGFAGSWTRPAAFVASPSIPT